MPCSGVAATYYTVDSGSTQTYAGAPIQVSGDGSHTVTYWSVDAAGNIEEPRRRLRQYRRHPADGRRRQRQRLARQRRDGHPDAGRHRRFSVLAGTQYRLQGSSTWLDAVGNAFVVTPSADGSGDGVQHYEYRALDNAGNASVTGPCTVRIDTQAPAVTTDADAYWHNSAVTVHLQATDTASGVDQISYRPQGATAWTSVAGDAADVPVAAPTDGQPHSSPTSTSRATACGNMSTVATFTVNIDPRMPNTTVSGLPAAALGQQARVAYLQRHAGRRRRHRAHRVLAGRRRELDAGGGRHAAGDRHAGTDHRPLPLGERRRHRREPGPLGNGQHRHSAGRPAWPSRRSRRRPRRSPSCSSALPIRRRAAASPK